MLSTLRHYVESMGGKLELVAQFPNRPPVVIEHIGAEAKPQPKASGTRRGARAAALSYYIESFNGRLRDECLNEHWFISLGHAKTIIEAWRQEYNHERPKKVLEGLTPAAYARQLAEANTV